ncbi:hypothetical protein SBOR_0979 [Sclerotinia borealis F-4128]|uniref:PIG-P domain-containing protein n=1 Tax=Sclerotinia borealis (strain F-4128) TaxID=1432307 RepID=W9CVK4_SCLBF|nr:hypothetical protein SBOR_0979 [Sclerotinia borealis F-4128]
MTSSSTSSSPSSSPPPDPDDYLFQSNYQSHAPQTQPSPISTPRPHSRQSTSSSSSSDESPSPPPLQHNFFAPPFYNRPPTPLPPSPSLTSLLRPSRPTTPDSSADELEPPVPRASPKVPTYEYYGFVLYLFSSLTFLLYLLWSYLPSPFLRALGIYYYPNRWWSLALPSWIVMLLVYIYVALASYNTGHLTLGMSSVETIIDGAANVCLVDGKGMAGASNASPISKASATSKANPSKASPSKVSPNKANLSKPTQEENTREKEKERKRTKERERERERESQKGTGYTGSSGKERERERGVGYSGGGGKEAEVRAWTKVWSRGTDAVMDVPLGGVCEILYGEGREGRGMDDGDYDDY